MRRIRKPFALLLLAAACSCGGGTPLSAAVLDQPPSGYHRSGATGGLDADAASQATPARSADVKSFLNTHSLSDGYSAVWQSGSDFITVVALRFNDSAGAKGLIQLEQRQLKGAAANLTPDGELPGASTYVFYGSTRLRGHQVFCSGELFPEQNIAFVVTTCSAFPNSAVLARRLALDQYLKAQRVLKLAVPAPATT